jgi:hypothetical protein
MKTSTIIDFGTAIKLMKTGANVARAGWNGKGMFIYLNRGSCDWQTNDVPAGDWIGGVPSDLFENGDKGSVTRMPNINMHAADGSTVTGWLASQTDMLAEDWVLRD